MFQITFFVSALWLLTISKAEPPVPQYGVPFGSNPPINSYGTPNYDINNDQQSHDHGEPKSYEFGYQVKDDYTGNNYGRQERSDGNQVTGEYRVQLPDGRTQIVTYYADWKTGYHADVRYEGQPQYPDQLNNNIYNNPNIPSNQYGPPGSNQYGPPGSNQYPAPGSNQYGPPNPNQYGPAGPNQYDPPGQNQYGPPGSQRLSVGQYRGNQNYDSPARSSVAIKGLSGGGGPYRGSDNYRGVNDGVNFGSNNYDSFGSRLRPGTAYGYP